MDEMSHRQRLKRHGVTRRHSQVFEKGGTFFFANRGFIFVQTGVGAGSSSMDACVWHAAPHTVQRTVRRTAAHVNGHGRRAYSAHSARMQCSASTMQHAVHHTVHHTAQHAAQNAVQHGVQSTVHHALQHTLQHALQHTLQHTEPHRTLLLVRRCRISRAMARLAMSLYRRCCWRLAK